jgi:hypothetical protein
MSAEKEPQDGLHHQKQIIFRNTSSPWEASWELSQLALYWRNRTQRPFLRSLPWAIFSITYVSLFGLAGVFSSEITKAAGSERLILGQNCGTWLFNQSGESQQALYAYSQKDLNDTILAANYARSCYQGSYDALQCNVFVNDQISWSNNQNATCPFESGICRMGNTAAYRMDTGPMNSHYDFGINTPTHERVTYRKVATCAPLHTTGFVRSVNESEPAQQTSDGTILQYFYGPSDTNWTYVYYTHSRQDSIGYTVQ